MSEETFRRMVGRKTLIVGEADAGKTPFLARFLDYLVERGLAREVTVIDMAPERRGSIGGRLEDYTLSTEAVRYLKPWRIIPPRLTGNSAEEVRAYAEENRLAIQPLIAEYLRRPTRILLINDITIYLHAGEFDEVEDVVKLSETFAATAYQGSRLSEDKGSGITERERKSVKRLKELVDEVLELSKQ